MFITLAFAGGEVALVRLILTQWTAKIIYEAAATPLTYLVVGWIKRREGLDHYDYDTSFNPIAVTRLSILGTPSRSAQSGRRSRQC